MLSVAAATWPDFLFVACLLSKALMLLRGFRKKVSKKLAAVTRCYQASASTCKPHLLKAAFFVERGADATCIVTRP